MVWDSLQQTRKWNYAAEIMMLEPAESGHPVLRCTSPLSRGTLKNRGGEKSSLYYNADLQAAVLHLRAIMAVNQLSIIAVATMCKSKGLPQTAQFQMEEGAGRDVPQQLVTRLTKHRTQDKWARRDMLCKRDEREKTLAENKKLTQVSRCWIHNVRGHFGSRRLDSRVPLCVRAYVVTLAVSPMVDSAGAFHDLVGATSPLVASPQAVDGRDGACCDPAPQLWCGAFAARRD